MQRIWQRETSPVPPPRRTSVRAAPGARRRVAMWLLAVAFGYGAPSAGAPGASRAEAPSAPALVAASPLEIRPLLGFSGTFRLDRWTPLTVVVENRGVDVTGTLEVAVTSAQGLDDVRSVTRHRRRLELPGDSRKRLRFTVFPDSLAVPIQIRIASGEREIAREEVDLRRRFTESALLLVISRDADLDYLNRAEALRIRVLYPRPELLPDRWQGYDGVAAIVLHGVSLEHLESRQFDALVKWIAQGGRLLVSGGPDYALVHTPRLASLVPARPLGLVEIPNGRALGDALGAPVPAPRPFDVNRLGATRGRVSHVAQGIPLVVEETRGRGAVTFLAFDVTRYPFADWSGMTALWSTLLPGSHPSLAVAPRAPDAADTAPYAMVKSGGRGFPDHPTLLAFLALYLGSVIAAGRLRRASRIGALLPAWVAWVSPIMFAPAAYLLFGVYLYPSGASAVAVSVIEPFGHGPFARLHAAVGMYSNRWGRLALEHDGAEPLLRPARWPGRASDHEVNGGPSAAFAIADPRAYVLHVVEGTDVVAFDVDGAVVLDEGRLRVRVSNRSGRRLRDAWLLLDGRAHRLGAIPVEADFERSLDPSRDPDAISFVIGGSAWEKLLKRSAGIPARDRDGAAVAIERALARRLEGRGGARTAMLLATAVSPFRLSAGSTQWSRRELGLVLAALPIARIAERSLDEAFEDTPTVSPASREPLRGLGDGEGGR